MTRALLAALLLLASLPARAGGVAFQYDSFSVAAGGAIDSGKIPVGTSDEVSCVLSNASGAATRTLVVNFVGDDQTVLFAVTLTATAISSTTAVAIATGATSRGTAGANGSVEAIPIAPFRYMQFTVAAAGAAAARLTCQGRY